MPKSIAEARHAWQESWRQMPRKERGSARRIFAFITGNHAVLPTDWEDRELDPWTTIHGWLQEADEEDGIERQS